MEYLAGVTLNPYTTAWDQTMFFMEALNRTLFMDYENTDFALPKQVVFMHQHHFNAFIPPASKDWQAYEWQPVGHPLGGSFIVHFAGCPWQEKPCLDKMYEKNEYAIADFQRNQMIRNGQPDPLEAMMREQQMQR